MPLNKEYYLDTKVSLSERIAALIESYDYVSFAELNRKIPDTKGEYAFVSGDNPHLIWWPSISEAVLPAIQELRVAGRIHPHVSEVLVYFLDGFVPNIPIAKRNVQYKTDRWLPVVFRPGKACTSKHCPGK